MKDTFEPGELFVYVNGDRWELGMVKRPNDSGTGYYCWYSRGDTAANTPVCYMHKLENAGFTRIEQMLDESGNRVGGGFDEERYRKVCDLLEDATTTMSEWGQA